MSPPTFFKVVLAACATGGLWLALASAVAWGGAPSRGERVWTDRQGREVVGQLDRVEGRNVILIVAGEPTAVPLAQLSERDRAFLRGEADGEDAPPSAPGTASQSPPAPLGEPRSWKINDRIVVAAFAGADEQGFALDTNGQEMYVGYEVVQDAGDAAELVGYLQSSGRRDLAEVVIAAYERNTGRVYPRPGAKPTPSPQDEPDTDDPDDDQTVGAADVVTGIVDPVLPSGAPTRYRTADQVFNDEAHGGGVSEEELAQFRTRTLWAAVALVAVIAGVMAIGWFTLKRES